MVYGENSEFDAVILDAYGLGNLPSNTKLTELIAARSKSGLQTFVTTQCHTGNVSADYASSAERLGGILCADMTLPAIYCKVSLLIKKVGRSTAEARRVLSLPVQGDISPPDRGRLKLPGWVYRYFESMLEPFLKTEFSAVSDKLMESVFLSAGAAGFTTIVQDLLSQDAGLANRTFADNTNILHCVAFHKAPELLDFLPKHLSDGALRVLARQCDGFGISPVGYALRTKKLVKLKQLAELTGESELDELCRRNLLSAAAEGDWPTVEMIFLSRPRELQKVTDLEGRNLLHVACFLGQQTMVRECLATRLLSPATLLLLCQNKDMDGCSPADLARLANHSELAELVDEFVRCQSRKPKTENLDCR